MSVVAAFNHACLEDVGRLPHDLVVQRFRLIAACSEVIRRGRAGLPIRVSRDLGATSVGGSERFDAWANRNRHHAALTDPLTLLLSALSGPFVSDLDLSGPEPEATEPAIDDLRSDLFELLLLLLQHGLAVEVGLWLLSVPPDGGVSAPQYLGRRESREARLVNLRCLAEVEAADKALVDAEGLSHAAVLDGVESRFPRIVVTEKARRGLRQYTPDCPPTLFRATIETLDRLGAWLDEGRPEDEALRQYKLACTVEVSHESKKTMATPSLRALREVRIAGKTEEFSLHAKPGCSARVYILCRKEPHPTSARATWTRVYVGHCGKHLPTE